MAMIPAHHGNGYAGMEGREIKALDPGEVDALLAGEGMGFALAAELNGSPGSPFTCWSWRVRWS
jgi:hypothetical protein